MQNPRLSTIFLTSIALSLSACSSSSTSPTTSGSDSGSSGSKEVLIGQPSATGPAFKGSGKWSATTRSVERFYAVELRDKIKVQINVGTASNMSVETDDNLVDVVQTKVENGKLIISVSKPFQAAREPEVLIGVPDLSQVTLTGAGDMIVNGVKGDIFKVESSGSGNFFATGKVIHETLSASGAGKVDCLKVEADDVKADASGAGDIYLSAIKALDAKLSGSGNIKYKGSPASLTKSDTGAGTISEMTQ